MPQDQAKAPGITRSLVPIRPEEFGYEQARHLLWRAGFGGSDAQVRRLASWGPEKSVDVLLDFGGKNAPFDPVEADRFDRDIVRPATEEERRAYRAAQQKGDEDELDRLRKVRQDRERQDRQQVGEVAKWWLTRMIETDAPLEEKLTLFWHGHFATSYRTIENSYHMFAQNQFFRANAAGNFADLLLGIIRDPAMIAYLDNNDSRKNRPNENLAREIMELFSLGIGNYSEQDIKEGARALTGYTFEDDEFRFVERNHDFGAKTILGRSGNLNGEDFVSIILSKRACADFVARRLYNFFVADVPPDERGGAKELPQTQRAVLRELGEMLYARGYNLRPVLKRLFLSRHFYDPSIVGQQIKSPAVLVVGAVRSLQTPVRDLSILLDAMDLMGQRLFFPPSVKGWDGGRAWINTSTLFVRQNILAYLVAGRRPVGYDASADTDAFDAMAMLETTDDARVVKREPGAVAEHLLRVTLGRVPSEGLERLRGYFASESGTINQRTVANALLLITAMPEYQLC
ncbi:MAG TPA: DUF1800 domain-containing protein [Acetobacteraceae bacterium]|nr:DUF1800 domain-containing protein [Acetobacteraceae bacterium]